MYSFSRQQLDRMYAQVSLGLVASGAPLNATVHVNHQDCPAGVDTKRRLYATPTEDGSGVLFYCHHCQGKGIYRIVKYTSHFSDGRVDKTLVQPTGRTTFYDKSKSGVTLADLVSWYETGHYTPLTMYAPADIKEGYDNSATILSLAEVWKTLTKRDCYGIKIKENDMYIDRDGKPVTGDYYYRIMLPVIQDGSVTGLWIRNHPFSKNKVAVFGSAKKILFDTDEKERVLVIVEDPISAIKLDCLGVPAYSLGGLDMTAGEVIKLRALYDRIVVWLDNDTASDNVIDVIVRTLQLAGVTKVQRIESLPEPKKCSVAVIQQELRSRKIRCIV